MRATEEPEASGKGRPFLSQSSESHTGPRNFSYRTEADLGFRKFRQQQWATLQSFLASPSFNSLTQ